MFSLRILLLFGLFFSVELYSKDSKPLSTDSLVRRAEKVYQTDPSLAYKYSKQAVIQSQNEKKSSSAGKAYEMLGVSCDYLGDLDSALICFDKAIELLNTQSDQLLLASVYKSKANSLCLLYKNEEALVYYVKASDIFKKNKSFKQEASCVMGIGNVYSSMKFYNLSLNYYHQSLKYFEEQKDSIFVSYLLTNIAEVYATLKQDDKELEYHRKALAIKEKLRDDYGLVYSYSNMAVLLARIEKKDSALYYANKAIEISQAINNQEFLTSSYQALGNVYVNFKQYNDAIKYYNMALVISRKLLNTKAECNLLKEMADLYIKSGDYKNATNYLSEFIIMNDSINNVETKKSFDQLQTQFETEKKEKEISLLNERDKKRRIVIYSIIGLSLLLGLLSFVLFNRFRLKRRVANELEIRNTEISNQKNIIEEKQKEITDSIHYAKRIQNTLLTHKDFISHYIPSNFIFFKPKDIVSGDFYWATKKDNYFYLAVCDSTGHGVPGAFISLLNIGFLSEAINEKNISEPNLVFNYVRERLINSISRDGQKDGFDGILLRINSVTKEISYAAANNAPVLVSENEIFELQKDRMPVGQDDRMESFNLYTIKYNKGDTLYLYTDGFADQFGGPKGKKYKGKSLNNHLLSIHQLSMTEQQTQLNQRFEEWRGDLEQVDDVCVVGLML
jgi:serine phosphatase RsbU (regulator of sigma subunit)